LRGLHAAILPGGWLIYTCQPWHPQVEMIARTLTNRDGMVVKVSEFGAILTSVHVPDRQGNIHDLTLGYDHLEDWVADGYYFGSTVGRYGNRIAEGKFSLDGAVYPLATNNDPGGIPCHLHGGEIGFNKKLWKGTAIPGGVELSYLSVDGEEGYPGEVTVTVTYLLNDDNELTWQAEATTTRATPINLIHHSYWNLSGDPTSSATDHLVTLNADHYLPTCEGMIPTGELVAVEGTPMDFREEVPLGHRIEGEFQCLQFAEGYDHCYVISGEGLRLSARATDPKSGRSMEVHTDQPGIHLYTANFVEDGTIGKGGQSYGRRTSFCFETERFPNSPNTPHFPDCILRPGEKHLHTLVHKFSW
jgi:aldose 1-epimerase